jgi:hypothetical protein
MDHEMSCAIDVTGVLPFVPAFPCVEAFVTFTFSQQLPSPSFHLLSLPPVTPSFELFASPDEPFATLFLSLTNTVLAIVPSVVTIYRRRISRASRSQNDSCR